MADTSSSTDDDQGTSSNPSTPNPPLTDNTPRRRRGRGRGRSSGSRGGGSGRESISPRSSRQERGAGSFSASSSAAGASGQYGGFLEAPMEALPILDSGNVAAAAAAAPGLVIRSPSVGKRGRDAASSSGGNDQGSPLNCTVCGKELKSPRALYGHMRAVHPGRQYVLPPPVLTAEEERPPRGAGGDVEEGEIVDDSGAPAPAPAPAPASAPAPTELEEPPRRLPDLNYPPPEEDM